jgi:glycosyltransferase involved in cell wall biosynthesis
MTKIFVSYIKPKTFSGQSISTDLIMTFLNPREYHFVELPLFAIDRSKSSKTGAFFSWIRKSMKIIPGLVSLLFTKKPVLYINLGQSYSSFMRVLWWFLPLKLVKIHLKCVISLNGHLFMGWDRHEFKSRIFFYLLNSSKCVTVVGVNQRKRLLEWGLNEKTVLVVPNTCELNTISTEELDEKHYLPEGKSIKLLHLSLLIESKGFPEYLKALEFLSEKELSRSIDAVLCGPMSFTEYCKTLQTPEIRSEWIKSIINRINNSDNGQVHVEWIPGARGASKEKLFSDAHIFVFPTYFPVEAQPLVLLEAMSEGCAIITSTAGEIRSTLSNDSAIILNNLSIENIAENILKLIEDDNQRIVMTRKALKIINGPLSLTTYAKTWEAIFDSLNS